MNEFQKSGVVDHAAMKAGMHRETATRYLAVHVGPEAAKRPHTWRTRSDPLSAIWPETERWLEESPDVEAKALFEHLLATHPGQADGRALRTFQRRVADWLRRHGPPKEVYFPQVHEPGECIQTDWTNANELKVTINGEPIRSLALPVGAAFLQLGVGHSLSIRIGSLPPARAAGRALGVGWGPLFFANRPEFHRDPSAQARGKPARLQ